MTHQTEDMKQLKIIISGGGSGGHIFLAVAIAKSLKQKNQNIDFLFVGAKDKMEMEKISNEGFKIVDDPNHPNKSFTKQFVEKWERKIYIYVFKSTKAYVSQ